VFLLIAAPAFATPCGEEICLPVLSGHTTFQAGEDDEDRDYHERILRLWLRRAYQQWRVWIFPLELLGSPIHLLFPEYGGDGQWIYQGNTYKYIDGFSAPGVFALVGWASITTVDVILGMDTAPATIDGHIAFFGNGGAAFHFTGTGIAQIDTQISENFVGGRVLRVDFGSSVATPEPSIWLRAGRSGPLEETHSVAPLGLPSGTPEAKNPSSE
jgi:hypothetical protein